jgi:DNA adenine methylase
MTQQAISTVSPRPFLKWAGGKSQLIEQYQAYFPQQFQRYYEPFLGGGAVFFFLSQARSPFTAYLSDINTELVNVYQIVRDRADDLIAVLEKHQTNHSKDYYYELRSRKFRDPVKKAARIIYLNRTCFNGLYRENSKGEFNVPIGRYKNPKICDRHLLKSVSEILRSTQIDPNPFNSVLESATNSEDFVYFDPPYYPLNATSRFTGYSRYSFSERDQIELKEVFAELGDRGVKVMLSNSDCSFIRELYSDFKIHTVNANRAINSKGNKRGKINEVLVTSY